MKMEICLLEKKLKKNDSQIEVNNYKNSLRSLGELQLLHSNANNFIIITNNESLEQFELSSPTRSGFGEKLKQKQSDK